MPKRKTENQKLKTEISRLTKVNESLKHQLQDKEERRAFSMRVNRDYRVTKAAATIVAGMMASPYTPIALGDEAVVDRAFIMALRINKNLGNAE